MIVSSSADSFLNLGNVSLAIDEIKSIKSIEWNHAQGVRVTCKLPGEEILRQFLLIKGGTDYEVLVAKLKQVVGKND